MSYSIGIDIGVASVGMAMVDENEKIFGSVSVCIDSNRYVSRLRWSERWRYVFRRS